LQVPSWYALLLIGFIKETTFPFLFCFIAVRMIVQLRAWSKRTSEEKSGKTFLYLLIGELGIALSLLIPVVLYIYFRVTLISARGYIPRIENLVDLSIYPVIIRSFIEQFGPFLFFFLGGCIWLAIRREFIPLLYYAAVIVVTLVFNIMDTRAFIGYSRFNLFILPVILAGSVKFITWASQQKRYISIALILIAIGSNLLLSPIHLDGAKTAYWGNYLTDTSEHYYPYQDALVWLKNNHAEKRMLFTGMDFYYPFSFYWNKLDWKPKKDGIPSEGLPDETLAISSILKKAESEHYSVVVYRVLGKDPVLPGEMGEFRVQVIKNSAHTLLIFYKP
ncbi:MAG TPA: hypothetical protein VLE49_17825, partial [Anaerolineales bacterium]|nr:hypothetical protein [Anaerolineales bacterium]